MRILKYLCLLLFTALILPTVQAAVSGEAGDEEPLMPEEAFKFSAKMLDADTVRAQWDIADGYYLYRGKFKFKSDTPAVSLGTASFPPGKVKEDEFFGKVEIYRHQVAVDLPITRSGNVQKLDLTLVSQGCADMGICYPPQTHTVSLNLPAAVAAPPAPTADAKSGFDPLAALKNLGSNLGLTDSSDNFLPPEQAFVFSAEAVDGNTLRAHWDIADGVYLYRDKFHFELQGADGIRLGKPVFPAGQKKVDESFGEMVVYHHSVDIDIPLERSNLNPAEVTLLAKYQGCADAGFCYPPIDGNMPVSLPAGLAQAATTGTSAPAAAPRSEQDRIADSLASGNTLLTVLSFFGFGLLLAFTPCVFPMIPILSSIIVGQGEQLTTRRAFTMSLVYVLAMALTYTVAGIVAGLFGENLQAAFQNPWILGTFSAVFVALSFSMFGFYDLQMPSFIQSRLTEVSNRQQGGTLTGVAIMGLLSALIVGPCVAAPLMGALIYIGQTGDAWLGGMALFSLSLGMGAPLLVIGTSAGKLLPRAGGWMDAIKAVFGVMLLAVAIWMLERILPEALSMGLWALLLIVSAIYMGALEPVGAGSGWRKLWKGVGVAMLLYGALMLIGVAAGGRDVMQPLYGLAVGSGGGTTGAGSEARAELTFKRIKGIEQLDREIAAASAAGRPVMLDFYADWCVSCKEMEKYTFADAGVQQMVADNNTVLLQADVTANDADDKALFKRYGLIGPPAILFYDNQGQERRAFRVVGFMKAEVFKEHIKQALR